MAEYTPPPKNNIPFSFNTGGYQSPDFNNISANFDTGKIKQQMASFGAAIKGIRTYQHETFTFLKYCETYIVGYSQHGVQVIKGKCHYGGIRDLGATIAAHDPVNLPATIGGLVAVDLPAYIAAFIRHGDDDLSAEIGAHLPRDLSAYIDMHDPENITAYIRGFAFRDLPAYITSIHEENLTASLFGIPPEDLSAYLKVWPQEDLPGFIHGWQEADLSAYINMIGFRNLGAIIGGHRPRNLGALIKGWVREATYDLGAAVHSFALEDLGAFIRATEMAQLPAYLFPVQPRNISAFIHGWQEADLGGIINPTAYPWNLPASINITGGYTHLPASIEGKRFLALPTDLSAYILVTQGVTDLPAQLWAQQARNLTAYIDPGQDIGNLTAEIYPKRIRLTGILGVVTMEHSDLSATISIPCFYSNFKDLSSYIRPVYQRDLSAQIYPKGYVWAQNNLSATFGYATDTVVTDKLNINIHIEPLGWRTEDKFNVDISVFRSGLSLGASITGYTLPVDLTASIVARDVLPYDFESWKGSEKVFDTSYTQVLQDYEEVDISFQTIVKDYFYSSGSDVVAKVDKYTHFVTKVASYYSPTRSRILNRKLHKVKYLYDMRHFATTDEAMRYAIWYVTTTPTKELSAYINSVAPDGDADLTARIGATRYFTEDNNLTSYINGKATHDYDVIIAYTDDGVGYLEF